MRASPILLALLLCACASTTPIPAPQPLTYVWLSQPGLAADRVRYRDQFDGVLRARGYAESERPALALSIATDVQPPRDRDIGYGIYSGGFSYFTPRPAPAGYVEVVAFDITSMRPAWRARWLASSAADSAAFEQVPDAPHPLNQAGGDHDTHH